jgi:rhomboid protease GluP
MQLQTANPMKAYHFLDATVATTPSRKTAATWSLVLWAADIVHEVVPAEDDFLITVDRDDLENARRELRAFEEENLDWPPKPAEKETSGTKDVSTPPTVLLMGALVLIYAIGGPWSDGSPWFANGAVMGDKILNQGEWWRVVTALTLHSNPVHLLGNVLIGGFLVHFLLRAIGSGLGFSLLLFCGAAGNALNIMAHGPDHNSVGFSTAVFATIGILTGQQCIRKKDRIRAMLPPLAAGLGLLAMLGSSGEHTDLGAHLFGLLTGVVAGITIALLPGIDKLIANRRLQTTMLFIGLGFISLCWVLAFRRVP